MTETYTKHELLEFVLESADEDEEFPDKDEFNAMDETPSTVLYLSRFGSWDTVRLKAGKVWERDDTSIDDVVADDTAETPSEKTIRNRFGTWRRAVRQAGYEPRPSDPQE